MSLNLNYHLASNIILVYLFSMYFIVKCEACPFPNSGSEVICNLS